MTDYIAELKPENEFVSQLLSDFEAILRDELRNHGYDPDAITDQTLLIAAYGSLCARRVVSKPRTVHINNDIAVPENMKEGFDSLMDKFRNGADVNPHLSRFSAKTDSNDMLFYDWNISHFHLGTSIESDGFIKRTGPLAYAVVKENDVYIIDVLEHGNWSEISLISIIDSQWPELIAGSRVQGTFEMVPTSDDIRDFRNAHVNVGITLPNGHSYISIGGGFTTSGHSALSIMEANRLHHYFRDLRRQLDGKMKLNADDEYIAKNGKQIDVRLKRVSNDLILYTPNLKWEGKILDFRPLPA